VTKSVPFRVQSHILKLLGDQLIGHDRLAVFELVKNSYDADARTVTVNLDLLAPVPKISVRDNGIGMSADTIENAWLQVGTDSKRIAAARKRSPLGRFPLGEKGVGRLAVQKLGDTIKLVTCQKDQPEHSFSISWEALVGSARYLGDGLQVQVTEHPLPEEFKSGSGTLVEITDLHHTDWSRREIRDLYRLVTSLCNPFEEESSFKVVLELPGNEAAVADLPSLDDMLASAVWKFDYTIAESGLITWSYEFRPPRFKGLTPQAKGPVTEKLALLDPDPDEVRPRTVERAAEGAAGDKETDDDHIFVRPEDLEGIGPISGCIYAFHRRDEILKASGAPQQLKKWLEQQTGVRVYRDNIRVFNYGEVGEDWLGLDARRINRPAGKLGTQSVIAQISLDLAKSPELREKTNREGFDENSAFRRLRRISLSVFDLLQRLHGADRSEIDRALKGDEDPPPVQAALERLEALGKKHHIEKEVKPVLQAIKAELKTFQEVMVSSGLAGMNLALIFHEIVHSIDRMQRRLQAGADPDEVRREVDYLRKLLETFKPLLQRDPARNVPVDDLVRRALGLHEDRFVRHEVVVSNWTADSDKRHDFSLSVPRGLMVAAISNVIDNAIYWTRFRRERDNSSRAAILVLASWDEESGGMIAVCDNGPGFQLPRDYVGKPFSSTRAGGMGLGLFYCKAVMESIGGSLEVVDASELNELVDLPAAYDGSAVIFRFQKK
jgi:signal transduction histidine kinase